VALQESKYTTKHWVREFVDTYCVCHESVIDYVSGEHCSTSDRVHVKPNCDTDDYNFVYNYLFKEMDVMFPLSDFELKCLRL